MTNEEHARLFVRAWQSDYGTLAPIGAALADGWSKDELSAAYERRFGVYVGMR